MSKEIFLSDMDKEYTNGRSIGIYRRKYGKIVGDDDPYKRIPFILFKQKFIVNNKKDPPQ